MNVYSVTNGYIGYSVMFVLVVAETEARARELAAERFKSASDARRVPYPENYWTNLQVEFICSTDKEFASEVMD